MARKKNSKVKTKIGAVINNKMNILIYNAETTLIETSLELFCDTLEDLIECLLGFKENKRKNSSIDSLFEAEQRNGVDKISYENVLVFYLFWFL